MKEFEIAYWDAGDRYRVAKVKAETEQDAVELLVNDEQHPLAQVDRVEVVEDRIKR